MRLIYGIPKIDFEKDEDDYYIILDNDNHLFLYVVFESCLTMDDGIDQIWPHEFSERIKAYYKLGKIDKREEMYKLYKRKDAPHEFIRAFVFGEDENPSWFFDSKKVIIPQRLIYESGQTLSFLPGDYICQNLNGNFFVEKKEGFLKKFKLLGE